MATYLGFDSSTQSLTATVIEITGTERRIVFEHVLEFDAAFPEYGTTHGVFVTDEGRTVTAPPDMWAAALDRMAGVLAASGLDLSGIRAVAGAAQQHGSVYLTGGADAALARLTGSRAYERFTAAQIRKFATTDPAAYARTERIHLVSSFMASLLAGRQAPLEPGDASGMNLMDLEARLWSPAALDATAPDLGRRLPPIHDSWSVIGEIAPYWRRKYGFGPACVIPWSGDNPSSLIGLGLIAPGAL